MSSNEVNVKIAKHENADRIIVVIDIPESLIEQGEEEVFHRIIDIAIHNAKKINRFSKTTTHSDSIGFDTRIDNERMFQ